MSPKKERATRDVNSCGPKEGALLAKLARINDTARAELPQFQSRRAFCTWAVLAGFAPPARLTEAIMAELAEVS